MSKNRSWADRVKAAYDVWTDWRWVPGRFRMDRSLKAAGLRDLIVERDALRKELKNHWWCLHTERCVCKTPGREGCHWPWPSVLGDPP